MKEGRLEIIGKILIKNCVFYRVIYDRGLLDRRSSNN